jgi:MFS superfamily sulfate permease-like transporter
MILAAINSRVGTLIPPSTITASTTNATNGYFDMNATTMDYTEQSTATFGSTLSSIATTMRSSSGAHYLSNDPAQARMMVGAALALVAGLVHLAMAILHFGYVTVYLSDSIVQGFTTGCAIHIITSQIPPLLGIRIQTVNGQSKVIKSWIEIFKNIKYSNGATCICSAISIALFAGVRDNINERFKGRMPIPVPIELIIVRFYRTTSFSFYYYLFYS